MIYVCFRTRQSTGYPLATNPVIAHFDTICSETNFDLEHCVDKMVSFLAAAITCLHEHVLKRTVPSTKSKWKTKNSNAGSKLTPKEWWDYHVSNNKTQLEFWEKVISKANEIDNEHFKTSALNPSDKDRVR